MKNIIYCTICARGGSRGVAKKNIKKINNKALIFYTIDTAIKSKIFDRIILSTDSIEILNLCKKEKKIETFFLRKKSLSTNTSGKVGAIRDVVIRSEHYFNEKCNYVCDLDVTSPLRNINDIIKSYKKFKQNNFDNLFTVCRSRKNPYFNMIEFNKEKKVKLVKKLKNVLFRRQDAPTVYEMNASIYFWKKKILFKKNYLFRKNTGIYLMPFNRSVDIDTEEDFKLVKYFIRNNDKL